MGNRGMGGGDIRRMEDRGIEGAAIEGGRDDIREGWKGRQAKDEG